MSKKIFIFESDAVFAGEMEQVLARSGCQVTVVPDADAGLSLAVKQHPDLILLCVELPKVNGFSVCNKLKRDEALKSIPVIVMSAAATEETFRQHRSLRTRADDYVHKPVTPSELMRHIQAFLPIVAAPSEPARDVAGESENVESTDVVFSEPPIGEDERPSAKAHRVSDPDDDGVDNLADELHGPAELTEDDFAASNPNNAPVTDSGDLADEDVEIEEHLGDVIDLEDEEELRISGLPPGVPPAEPTDEGPRLGGTLTRLSHPPPARNDEEIRREELLLAKDQEIKRLKREIERTKPAAPTGSSSQAREFLDLRERLNKKDKELLEQREQINDRDKQLLALGDGAIDLERQVADLTEKHAELERERTDAQKLLAAASADKEQATKRSDDFKRMVEKLKGEIEARAVELTELRTQSDTRVAEAVATAQAEARGLLEGARNDLRREHQQQLAEALESARAGEAAAHAAALERVKQDFESERVAHQRAHDATLEKLHVDYEHQTEERAREAAEKSRSELETQKRDLEAQQKAALDARAEQHRTELEALKTPLATATEEATRLRAELEVKSTQLQGLETRAGQTEADLVSVMTTLEAKERLLDEARERSKRDRASFQRTKEILVSAVSVLEEAEERSFE